MVDFTIGEAWVDLLGSTRNTKRDAEAKLAKIDLSKSVDLEADAKKLEAEIATVKSQLKALSAEKANPSVELDIAVAEARRDELVAKLDELGAKTVTPKVKTDIATAQRELAQIDRELTVLNERKATADVDADITGLQTHLAECTAELDEVNAKRAQPVVTADVTAARANLDGVRAELDRLSMSRATPAVELQIANARLEILRVQAELDRLSAMRATPEVDAQVAQATAKLAVLRQQLQSIDGKTAHVNVDASGGDRAHFILMGVVAGLAAVSAAAPAAAAALAAVGGAAAAAGQGAAAAFLGFSGIGDALKASESAEKSAANTSASAGSTRASSAKQVASAVSALQQAQTQEARTTITGAQQVADAETALSRARVNADRVAVQGAQQVAAARQALADAQISADRRVGDAERQVGTAQESVRFAQEALTRARRDAAQANEDLQLSLSGVAISERRALLSQRKAQQALDAARSQGQSGDQVEELQLNVDEATQNLAEVRERFGDLREQQAQFARTGIDGTDGVTAAQQRLIEAQRGAQDAQRGLTEAQVDGSRQVAQAQQALAQAQQQAANANADAQQQVADAATALARAQQQAGWAQEDAARQVAEAQRALGDAMTETGAKGTSASNGLAYALGKLTPAGREFVRFMLEEWQPAWKRTSDAVATELLPRVETAMRELIGLEPVVTAGLAESGRVLGDLAIKGANLATSPAFRADFAAIMASNNRQMQSYGDAGIHLFGAFTDLWTVTGPISEQFARLTEYSTRAFESWIVGARASGDLQRWMQSAADTAMWLGDVLTDVAVDAFDVVSSLAPLGVAVVETARGVADLAAGITDFLGPGLTSVVVGSGLAAVAASKLGTAMKGLAVAEGVGGLRGFANVAMNVFNPAALIAGLRAGTFNKELQKSAPVAELAAARTTGFAGAATRVAGVLPLLGAAVIGAVAGYDALTTSSSEAADALLKGGYAASSMRAELAANDVKQAQYTATMGAGMGAIREWATGMLGTETTTKQSNAALQERIAVMPALEAAQARVTLAQTNYETALRTFGATAPQTQFALGQLQLANRNLEIQEIANRNATDLATASIMFQQQQTLGSLNADLARQQALLQVEQSQRSYNDAVARNGPASLEARSAFVQYEQSLLTGIASVQTAAQKQYELQGRTDAAKLATMDADRAAMTMAGNIQGAIPPALQTYIANMDAGRLSAIGARIETDQFGHSVVVLPGGKRVPIDAPGAIEARARVDELDRSVRNLQSLKEVKILLGIERSGPPLPGNFPLSPRATGGLVERARGGPILAKQVIPQRFAAGSPGPVSGPGGPMADKIPTLLSNGEYVVRARAVDAIGVPALDAINRMARGGFVGLASGGQPRPDATSAPAAPVAVPAAADPAQQAVATATLTGALATQAAVVSGQVVPALTAQNQATTLQQVAAGLLATTNTGVLTPALQLVATTENGLNTPASMALTAANQMLVTTGLMPLVSQLVGVVAPTLLAHQGQLNLTAFTQQQTALTTSLANANITATTLGMQFATQGQLGAVMGSLNFTGGTWSGNAGSIAGSNSYITGTTQSMSAGSNAALDGLRGGMGQTAAAAAGLADASAVQFGRMRAAAADPIRFVIVGPVGSLVDAFNRVNHDFALGRPAVARPAAAFAQGSEDHRAQIARPGTMRVWAEPETGGEAYIPLADSKRTRSTGILAQVADRFGYRLERFADGGIDYRPMLDPIFKPARDGAAATRGRFPGNTPAELGARGVEVLTDQTIAVVAKKLAEMAAAGMGPLGSGAPFYVREISRAAAVRGMGAQGATIGVATAIVESALKMYANTAVPASLNFPHDAVGHDHDSVGLFQQRQAGWGTLAQRMNAFGSASLFFNKLASFNWRGMNPGAAAQRVQVSAFPGRYSGQMGRAAGLVGQYGGFDQGGIAVGAGLMVKDVIPPERVLSPVETRSYNTLESVLGRGGMKVDMADTGDSGGRIEVNVYPREGQSETAIANSVVRRLDFHSVLA